MLRRPNTRRQRSRRYQGRLPPGERGGGRGGRAVGGVARREATLPVGTGRPRALGRRHHDLAGGPRPVGPRGAPDGRAEVPPPGAEGAGMKTRR